MQQYTGYNYHAQSNGYAYAAHAAAGTTNAGLVYASHPPPPSVPYTQHTQYYQQPVIQSQRTNHYPSSNVNSRKRKASQSSVESGAHAAAAARAGYDGAFVRTATYELDGDEDNDDDDDDEEAAKERARQRFQYKASVSLGDLKTMYGRGLSLLQKAGFGGTEIKASEAPVAVAMAGSARFGDTSNARRGLGAERKKTKKEKRQERLEKAKSDLGLSQFAPTIGDYYCPHCDMRTNALLTWEAHVKSKKHQTRELAATKATELTAPDANGNQYVRILSANGGDIKFFCDLCKMEMAGVVPCEQHVRGSRHMRRARLPMQQRLLGRTPPPPPPPPSNSSSSRSRTRKRREQRKRQRSPSPQQSARVINNNSNTNHCGSGSGGGGAGGGLTRNTSSVQSCQWCGASCNSAAQLNVHVQSCALRM